MLAVRIADCDAVAEQAVETKAVTHDQVVPRTIRTDGERVLLRQDSSLRIAERPGHTEVVARLPAGCRAESGREWRIGRRVERVVEHAVAALEHGTAAEPVG